MPAHTKGPWSILGYAGEHDEAGAVIISSTGHRIASTSHLNSLPGPINWAEYHANAKLITAAPDLLSELERMLLYLQRMAVYYELGKTRPEAIENIRNAKKAINKALGI